MPKLEVPEKLLCPITLEMFKEPVFADDGHTYEKDAIEKWVAEKGTSPKTRENLPNKFTINWDKKSQIAEFFEKNNICTFEQFFQAVKTGNATEIHKLNYLDSHLEARDDDYTPLHLAVKGGYTEVVRFLLTENVNLEAVYNLDCECYTPLHIAVEEGHIELVKLLLTKKANLEAEANGDTPLMIGSRSGNVEITRLLLAAKANTETKSVYNDGETPLHTAAIRGHVEIVKLLLAAKAEIETKDVNSSTPLHSAAGRGNVDVVKLFLTAGANVEAKDIYNATPLHWAAENNHVEVVKSLLAVGANLEVIDDDGNLPIHRAAQNGYVEVIKFLLTEKGDLVRAKTNKGDTPLHSAVFLRQGLLQPSKAPPRKVEHSYDFYRKNYWASHLRTIFVPRIIKPCNDQKNAEWYCIQVVKLLLENGADYKALNNANETPAQIARSKHYFEVAKFIHEYHQELKAEARKAPQTIIELEKTIQLQQQVIQQLVQQLEELTMQLTPASFQSNTSQAQLLSQLSSLYKTSSQSSGSNEVTALSNNNNCSL